MIKDYSEMDANQQLAFRAGQLDGLRMDTIRQIEKTLDVLEKVESMMMAEAQMNATKHLAEVVRPVPLAALVSSQIGDLTAWKARMEGEDLIGPPDEH